MAWLLNPHDYTRLVSACAKNARIPFVPSIHEQAIAIDPEIRRGHIRDTSHPEIEECTFAEFGERYARVMDDERRALDAALATLQSHLAPLDAGTAEVLSRTVGALPQHDTRDVDSEDLLLGLIDAASRSMVSTATRSVDKIAGNAILSSDPICPSCGKPVLPILDDNKCRNPHTICICPFKAAT